MLKNIFQHLISLETKFQEQKWIGSVLSRIFLKWNSFLVITSKEAESKQIDNEQIFWYPLLSLIGNHVLYWWVNWIDTGKCWWSSRTKLTLKKDVMNIKTCKWNCLGWLFGCSYWSDSSKICLSEISPWLESGTFI